MFSRLSPIFLSARRGPAKGYPASLPRPGHPIYTLAQLTWPSARPDADESPSMSMNYPVESGIAFILSGWP